jgi:hypothetical protein
VLPDGTRLAVPEPPRRPPVIPPQASAPEQGRRRPDAPTARVPLGRIVGARSGDKGGDANVGLWARTDDAYAWLRHTLDEDKLRQLLPEAGSLAVSRYELPNLRALNFVVHGLLGDGVAASTRADPQAKSLGEFLRGCSVEIPLTLLSDVNKP